MADRFVPPLTCEETAGLAAGFVLGALEPEDMARVRDHLATCDEDHPELAALGAVVPALARSVPLARPSEGLRGRILAAARAEAAARTETAARTEAAAGPGPIGPAVADTPPGGAPAAAVPSRPSLLGLLRRPAWAGAVAAILAIAILGAWNLQLRGQVDELAAYGAAVQAAMDVAAAPGGQLAVLTGQGGRAATGIAGLSSDGRVVLAMHSLAPTAGGHVYEAWLIGANGRPVPLGWFAVAGYGTGTLHATGTVEPGAVVAVTLEAGPGATVPTLPILAQGQAQGT
jgi:hypothetical protein